jgi:hypothetical protein
MTSRVQLPQYDRGLFHFHREVFSVTLKTKVGNTLTKDVVLRINLNIDVSPITSKIHTLPSQSETSRLLTSSLSLGIHKSDVLRQFIKNVSKRLVRLIEFYFVYYESIKRELKIRCIYECRCDEVWVLDPCHEMGIFFQNTKKDFQSEKQMEGVKIVDLFIRLAWRDQSLPEWSTEGRVSHCTSLCNAFVGDTGYKHWMDLTNMWSSCIETR